MRSLVTTLVRCVAVDENGRERPVTRAGVPDRADFVLAAGDLLAELRSER